MKTFDHTPCAISISTSIPKMHIFRFENFWLHHRDFLDIVQQSWSLPSHHSNLAKKIIAKFKRLGVALKSWKSTLSNLKISIANVKLVLYFVTLLEEFRDLYIAEWNFKRLLEQKLQNQLEQQHIYQKQRGKIKWVQLGDANTKFFHANATLKFKRNLITVLEDDNGHTLSDHTEKANLIWSSFKERLGVSSFTCINIDLESLLSAEVDCSSLIIPFTNSEIDAVVKSLPSDKALGPDGFNIDFCEEVLAYHIPGLL